ncbi:MAG: M20 family metallopeptidase [Rhodospirillaceae bacterium]|nr:M20 family metallopeptidase [Rhodospirillaceae bacterium]MCY4237900.1 M20 family metallopeptidase [Rhodospirillaceae bacterium]
MPVINRIADFHDDMTAWRRDIHAHPETAFEENRTANVVAEKLESFGVPVHRGLAKTGVVGSLKVGGSSKAIGLRADLDALNLQEKNDFDYKSKHEGKMHACGHDGHTTMLLGAARYLAETRNFDGAVHFIFQPAEEGEAGGKAMVDEGLFQQFPCEAVYGMHNWPGMPRGMIGVRSGAMMASADMFTIRIQGRGGHGAMPHHAVDPVVVGAQIVNALQTIASRTIDPLDSIVVSVTQFHSGTAHNVIPDTAELSGTCRALSPEGRKIIEWRMKETAEGIAAAHGARVEVNYRHNYPVLVNSADETQRAAKAAAKVVGDHQVMLDPPPVMGSEDFAFMLEAKPGSYVWIGNGVGEEGGCMVHNPHYDFSDDILPVGASYWATLVEQELPRT